MRSTPIILDRLAAALKSHGVDLKRSSLLETACAAFGYRNSHEFAAADKDGILAPAKAEPIGMVRIGDTKLVVLRDPVANAPYAIDASFIAGPVEEERRERFGTSPYGGLLDLDDVGAHPAIVFDAATNEGTADDANALRTRIADLELTIHNMTVIDMPDWKEWEKDLKKASHKRQEPVDDDLLHRIRHACADNHVKSSESERETVSRRQARYVEKHLGGLLARLDQAEDALRAAGLAPAGTERRTAEDATETLAAIEASAKGAKSRSTGLFHLLTSRDGTVVDEIIKADDIEDATTKGLHIAAERFRLDLDDFTNDDGLDEEDLEAETDSFRVEPVDYPVAATLIGDALGQLGMANNFQYGMPHSHPVRIKLFAALDAIRPVATA